MCVSVCVLVGMYIQFSLSIGDQLSTVMFTIWLFGNLAVHGYLVAVHGYLVSHHSLLLHWALFLKTFICLAFLTSFVLGMLACRQ